MSKNLGKLLTISGPCLRGDSLTETSNEQNKGRLKCVTQEPTRNVRVDLTGVASLCDRGFVFEASSKGCVERGSDFGDSLTLEGYLDEHFFGK